MAAILDFQLPVLVAQYDVHFFIVFQLQNIVFEIMQHVGPTYSTLLPAAILKYRKLYYSQNQCSNKKTCGCAASKVQTIEL